MRKIKRRLALAAMAAVLLAGAPALRGAGAQSGDPTPRAPAADPDEAWQSLAASARQRIEEADDRAKVAQQLLTDFADFARRFPGTQAAAVALYNRGMLANELGQQAVAEQSLKDALPGARDLGLKTEITWSLANVRIHKGAAPPAFSATTFSGKKISTADYKGKVLMIDFWATWCGPCREELPNVLDVYKKYHGKGLEIVSINLDDDPDNLAKFLKDQPIPWEQVFNADLPRGTNIAELYGAKMIPQMVVVGRDGIIRSANPRGPQLAQDVKAAIEEKPPATQPTTRPAE